MSCVLDFYPIDARTVQFRFREWIFTFFFILIFGTNVSGQDRCRNCGDDLSNRFSLDNIEFFTSDDPSLATTPARYTLYKNVLESSKNFYLTFNLDNRQTVDYELVDMTGRQIAAHQLPDVLNQTFKIDVDNANQGIYLVRLLIDKKYYVSRILVDR
jgi:hypothetical protein